MARGQRRLPNTLSVILFLFAGLQDGPARAPESKGAQKRGRALVIGMYGTQQAAYSTYGPAVCIRTQQAAWQLDPSSTFAVQSRGRRSPGVAHSCSTLAYTCAVIRKQLTPDRGFCPVPQLLDLFRVIDRGNTGRISFRSMQMYVNKYGGQTLNADELSSIFTDFKPGSDNLISQSEVRPRHKRK